MGINKGEQDISVNELADMFVNSMLEDNILNKADLLVKAKAFFKTFVNLKNIPKDYNRIPDKNEHARRLRTIEKREVEAKFWHNIVKELNPNGMQEYYKQQKEMLVEKGFMEA